MALYKDIIETPVIARNVAIHMTRYKDFAAMNVVFRGRFQEATEDLLLEAKRKFMVTFIVNINWRWSDIVPGTMMLRKCQDVDLSRFDVLVKYKGFMPLVGEKHTRMLKEKIAEYIGEHFFYFKMREVQRQLLT